jgi:hypothetical protein
VKPSDGESADVPGEKLGLIAKKRKRRAKPLTVQAAIGYVAAHGDFAISPRGDMPKYRVPLF